MILEGTKTAENGTAQIGSKGVKVEETREAMRLRRPGFISRIRTLILVLLGGLFVAGLFCTPVQTEKELMYRPSKYACPVTPNLFPEQERLDGVIRFTFPENARGIPAGHKFDETQKLVAQRISIALLSPDGKDVEIRFTWTGATFVRPNIDWGVHSGTFIIKADGNPNCFFLGLRAGLPGNIPCKEFLLAIPAGVEVKEVVFSNLGGEYRSKNCPMPELEKEIDSAYQESRQNPKDEAKTTLFLSLLEKAIPKYECIPKAGGEPVPAWYLADFQNIENWLTFLDKKLKENNNYALKVFAEFMPTAGGIWGEMMVYQIWPILHDRPIFVLENWEGIREFRGTLLESLYFNPPGSDIELISIYQDIAKKDPKYKVACDEIIETTKETQKKIRLSQARFLETDEVARLQERFSRLVLFKFDQVAIVINAADMIERGADRDPI